jgi:hypothetical protein
MFLSFHLLLELLSFLFLFFFLFSFNEVSGNLLFPLGFLPDFSFVFFFLLLEIFLVSVELLLGSAVFV